MKKLVYFLLISLFLGACSQSSSVENIQGEKANDQIYAYSVFAGLANKIYDGKLTVGELKQKGDLGLGTFNGLDGEMVVLDGEVFQVRANWTVNQMNNDALIPFAVVTPFEADKQLLHTLMLTYEKLKKGISELYMSDNMMYAFKISGKFDFVKLGSAPKQVKPYKNSLSEALVNRPTTERSKIEGTIVGFWLPAYFGKVNIPGYHLHFIANDRTIGGHLLDFTGKQLKIEMDVCTSYEFQLPQTIAFEKANFNLQEGYSKKK